MHAGRADDRAAGPRGRDRRGRPPRPVQSTSTIAEHDGQSLRQAARLRGFVRRAGCSPRKASTIGGSSRRDARARGARAASVVVARAEIAEGEGRLGGIRGALGGEAEIEPVLAVAGSVGAIEEVAAHGGRARPGGRSGWQAFMPQPVSRRYRRADAAALELATMPAERPSSQSQAGATGSPARSIRQVPSPWPVTASAAAAARSGTFSQSARSTAAAPVQVSRNSCSTAPPSPRT